MNFFATTPKGLELLLVEELKNLGAATASEKLAGVVFTGDLEIAYKACLWSRLANRILFPLMQFPSSTPEELYAGVQTISWDEHLYPEATIHVNFITTQSNITHTLFGAQKVKDAIVDQFREKYNLRPNVARQNPDISIHVYLNKNIASISIDLSGESLHKRGIRIEHGLAPLKENLAAAILLRSGWPAIAAAGGMLCDPTCGSGTLLIEAAQIAGNIAPGLTREYYGFLKWKKHISRIWEQLLAEAKQQKNIKAIPEIVGYDADPEAIKTAFANIERAGLRSIVHVEKRELSTLTSKKNAIPGLVVMNPPYGERLGDLSHLPLLYEQIGIKLKTEFKEWRAAVFTGNPELGKNMGLRAKKQYALFNEAIPCQLLLFDVKSEWFVDRSPESQNERRIRKAQRILSESNDSAIQMFVNRLNKNIKHIKRWIEKENILSYRLYDSDLPEYAVSIDRYNDFIVVKEYPAPKSIDKIKAEKRLDSVLAVLPEVLNIPAKNIYLLSSQKNSEEKKIKFTQYIEENSSKYYLALQTESYETGLDLSHRLLRSYVQSIANKNHVLNLYAHSGEFTIVAAIGGASSIVSVDPKENNLDWIQENLSLNQINNLRYKLIQADPLEWVEKHKSHYQLILVNLPEKAHRLREEYLYCIQNSLRLLQSDGVLLLTSRDARFKLDKNEFKGFKVEDIGKSLISPDFAKYSQHFHCWKITH